MAASVSIKEANGAGPDWTVKTAIRFSTTDAHAPGSNYPLPIPKTDFRYSYWKTLCLEMAGVFTKINNIKFFCDGAIGYALGIGGKLLIGTKDEGDSGLAVGSYDQADGVEGISGHAMDHAVDGHAVYKGAGYTVADIESYTSGAPLDLDSTDYEAAGKTKCAVLQCKCDTVANGAEVGVQNAETLTLRFDEI